MDKSPKDKFHKNVLRPIKTIKEPTFAFLIIYRVSKFQIGANILLDQTFIMIENIVF